MNISEQERPGMGESVVTLSRRFSSSFSSLRFLYSFSIDNNRTCNGNGGHAQWAPENDECWKSSVNNWVYGLGRLTPSNMKGRPRSSSQAFVLCVSDSTIAVQSHHSTQPSLLIWTDTQIASLGNRPLQSLNQKASQPYSVRLFLFPCFLQYQLYSSPGHMKRKCLY